MIRSVTSPWEYFCGGPAKQIPLKQTILYFILYIFPFTFAAFPKCRGQAARVAELVDAADSKSAVRKDVLVRFQSRAQRLLPNEGPFIIRSTHAVSGPDIFSCSNTLLPATTLFRK